MALKTIHTTLIACLLVVLFTTSTSVDRVQALSSDRGPGEPPLLAAFANQVENGRAGELRGIYIPEILAAPVVQQPAGHPEFVSSREDTVTQFSLASKFGSTGLLAHNYLAGEHLFRLTLDQRLYLVNGDGNTTLFVIKEILRYRALEPNSTTSRFSDLESGDLLTTPEVFLKVYNRPGSVILQTCISRENNPSWGRLFIIAEPYFPVP
jgi:hypothetical protein